MQSENEFSRTEVILQIALLREDKPDKGLTVKIATIIYIEGYGSVFFLSRFCCGSL
jgi:hypothetical protein